MSDEITNPLYGKFDEVVEALVRDKSAPEEEDAESAEDGVVREGGCGGVWGGGGAGAKPGAVSLPHYPGGDWLRVRKVLPHSRFLAMEQFRELFPKRGDRDEDRERNQPIFRVDCYRPELHHQVLKPRKPPGNENQSCHQGNYGNIEVTNGDRKENLSVRGSDVRVSGSQPANSGTR